MKILQTMATIIEIIAVLTGAWCVYAVIVY